MAKQDSPYTYATATKEARLHAVHHIAWEGVQLLRAHEFAKKAGDPLLRGLVATAAAIHTRSIGDFLFADREDRSVRPSDILAQDFHVAPGGHLPNWKALRAACSKEVAHLTWERVLRRSRESADLTRWAASADVGALLLQLVYVLVCIRDGFGEDYRPVARDGRDYILELEEGYERIQDWEHEDLLGIGSGSGAYATAPLFDDPK